MPKRAIWKEWVVGIKSCNPALGFWLITRTGEARYYQMLLKGDETGWAAVAPNIALEQLSACRVQRARTCSFKAHQNPYLSACRTYVGQLFSEIFRLFSEASLDYSFTFDNTTTGFRQSHLQPSPTLHSSLLLPTPGSMTMTDQETTSTFLFSPLPLFFNQISEV